MTSNDNTQRREGPFRVDLTSQDLRTGTVRLPRQLLDRFESGPLQATADNAEADLQLEFRAPRELHGLRRFFDDNNLRTNDALNLYLTEAGIHLEPFFRNRRRSEISNQRRSPAAGPQEAQSEPAPGGTLTNEEPAVQNSDAEAPYTADAFSNAVTSETRSDTAPEGSDSLAQPTDGEAPDSQGNDGSSGGGGEAISTDTDPFDDFGYFDDLGELDPLDMDLDPATADQLSIPDGQPEETNSQAAETPEVVQEPGDAPTAVSAAYHVVPRRPFSLTGSTARPDADQPADTTVAPTGESAARSTPDRPTPTGAGDTLSQVRRHLNQPGLPSILQETEVVSALGLPADDVKAALSAISQEPDSRLSMIRTGFWLLKQPEQE